MRQDELRNNLVIQMIPKLDKESVVTVIPTIAKELNIDCDSADYTVNQIITKKKIHLLLV